MKSLIYCLCFIWILIQSIPTHCEVIFDGTLNSNLNGKTLQGDFVIKSQDGRSNSNNLFHSFSQFNLLPQEIASFECPSNINNIISRVTGQIKSTIEGTIRTVIEDTNTISSANLYLINPAGIMFTSQATIDIGGSLYLSTADYVTMNDGSTYMSTIEINHFDEILSSTQPKSFGFLDDSIQPVEISHLNQGLEVQNGQSISIISGDIVIDQAELIAHEGEINLISLAQTSDVQLNDSINTESVQWGNITIQNLSSLNVSGNGAGSINIYANELNVLNDCEIASINQGSKDGQRIDIQVNNTTFDGSQIVLNADHNGKGTDLNIDAIGDIKFLGEGEKYKTSSIIYNRSNKTSEGAGDGSNITIIGKSILFQDGAGISGSTYGPGKNGNITLIGTEQIILSGISSSKRPTGIIITTRGQSTNAIGGAVNIETQLFRIDNGARFAITNYNKTFFGNIKIQSEKITLMGQALMSSDTRGEGKGVNIILLSNYVELDDSSINLTTSGSGESGYLSIEATQIEFNNGSSIVASVYSDGKGGEVSLISKENIIFQGVNDSILSSKISIENLNTINDSVSPNLKINAKNIYFYDGAYISAKTKGLGNAGTVTLEAEETIHFSGESNNYQPSQISLISTSSDQNAGDSGSLNIHANNVIFDNGAKISANTYGGGKGGDIQINATESVIFQGEGKNPDDPFRSGIMLNVSGQAYASEELSSLKIESKTISILDGAFISSDSLGVGKGGNIELIAQDSIILKGEGLFEKSYISASVAPGSTTGSGGDISLISKDIIIQNGAYINTGAFGGIGKGGNVSILADGLLKVEGASIKGWCSSIGSNSNPAPSPDSIEAYPDNKISGDGGTITIQANQLILSNGGSILSSSIAPEDMKSGNAGIINMTIEDTALLSGVNPYGENEGGFGSGIYVKTTEFKNGQSGHAGYISLNTGALYIKDGGIITSSTASRSSGGNIDLNVNNTLNISGDSSHISLNEPSDAQHKYYQTIENFEYKDAVSGIYASSELETSNSGKGGIIDIQAKAIEINDHGVISTSSAGMGDAGNIIIQANSLNMNTQSSITSASKNQYYGGAAGTISIDAGNELHVANNSAITTEAVNTIKLDTQDDQNNGKITIKAIKQIRLENSEITSSVKGGFGNGGDIDIDPKYMIMDQSQVIANAYEGNGGNIHIVADHFIQSSDSVVKASSQFGLDGNIKIDSPDVDVSSGLTVLPSHFLDASKWATTSCALRNSQKGSTLIYRGRDSVPLPLDYWQLSLSAIDYKKKNDE